MHEASVEKPNQSANHCSRFIPAHIRIDTQSRWRNPSNLGPTSLLLTALLTLAGHSPAQEQPQTPAPAASPSSATSTSIPSAQPAQAVPAPSKAVPKRPLKHLKRIPPEPGTLAAHPCAKEYAYRLEDFLASLNDKEIAEYEKKAVDRTGLDGWKADPDAMFFLSQIVRADAEGNRYTMPDKNAWFLRAATAGHPVALYQQALQDRSETPMSDTEILKRAEAAAAVQGSGEIAWQMANAYARIGLAPKEFGFLPADPGKALHWTKWAAERANIPAAERLCVGYARDAQAAKTDIASDAAFGIKNGDPQNDEQAVHWCVLAAQATCSAPSASALGTLFERGLGGLPKDALTELYWRKTGEYRQRRLSAAKWGAEEEASEQNIPLRYMHPHMVEPTKFDLMYRWRMENFLVGLTDAERAAYEKRAEAGDANAAWLLAQIPQFDGKALKPVYPLRERWLPVALKDKHPIALLQAAIEKRRRQSVNDDKTGWPEPKKLDQSDLSLIEAATRADGSGFLALRLAWAYQGDIRTDYYSYGTAYDLPRSEEKKRDWMQQAARYGNVGAAEYCIEHKKPMNLKNISYSEAFMKNSYWVFLNNSSNCLANHRYSISYIFSSRYGANFFPEPPPGENKPIQPDALTSFYWERAQNICVSGAFNSLSSEERFLSNLQEKNYE